jgi:hypothetical protein
MKTGAKARLGWLGDQDSNLDRRNMVAVVSSAIGRDETGSGGNRVSATID